MRHASARNVIERCFGILKRRFAILLRAPEYDMKTQAYLVAALAAIHNVIRIHDPAEITQFTETDASTNMADDEDIVEDINGVENIEWQMTSRAERQQAKDRRDQIAQAMWDAYQQIQNERGL